MRPEASRGNVVATIVVYSTVTVPQGACKKTRANLGMCMSYAVSAEKRIG